MFNGGINRLGFLDLEIVMLVYLNRVVVWMKFCYFEKVLMDLGEVFKLDFIYLKSIYRKGCVLYGL